MAYMMMEGAIMVVDGGESVVAVEKAGVVRLDEPCLDGRGYESRVVRGQGFFWSGNVRQHPYPCLGVGIAIQGIQF